MMHYRKKILFAAVAIAVSLAVAGCGGGGGGGSQSSEVVVTGRVMNYQDQSRGVQGAAVTIATYSGLSDSSGNFRIVMAENVVEPTFRVTAPSGFYSSWAMYNSKSVDPSAIPTPLPLYNGKDLGTIYLWDLNTGGPPPPPSW